VPLKEKFMVVYGGKNKHLLRQTGKIESRWQLNQLTPPLERLRVLGWIAFAATVKSTLRSDRLTVRHNSGVLALCLKLLL